MSWTYCTVDNIEEKSKLLPIWHGIDKAQLDSWNPGLSGIFALRNSAGARAIAKKIADVVLEMARRAPCTVGQTGCKCHEFGIVVQAKFPAALEPAEEIEQNQRFVI